MQATIYVTPQALAVATAIKDANYYDRMELEDQDPELPTKEGYFLKSIDKLHVATVPAKANVALRLVPEDAELYQRHVRMPTTLRGCIFENAYLPTGYAKVITYWSGPAVSAENGNSVFFQCPQNEYMVSLVPSSENGDAGVLVPADKLLSEGIVVAISEVEELTAQLSIHDFIELKVPVVQEMVGIEGDDFRTTKPYPVGSTQQYERVFLHVADILRSPDPNRIFVDLIHPLMISYGYFY